MEKHVQTNLTGRKWIAWIRERQRWAVQWLTNELEENKPRGTIAVLDGVRACAIILVIIYHVNRMTGDRLWDKYTYPFASALSTFGSSGVILFFILSGFLLFIPFAKALLFEGKWPSVRLFYVRRMLRILPGYYLSLFVIILLFQPQYLQPDHRNQLLLFLTFFMDSSRSTFRQLNGPYWTLGIEWWFYMLLPFITLGIYAVVRKVPRSRRLLAVACCLLGLMALGLFVRFWGFYLTEHAALTFLVPRAVLNDILFFCFGVTGKYIEVFALGMLVSLCYIYASQTMRENRLKLLARRASPWLFGAGLVLLYFAAMWHFMHDYNYYGWPFINALLPYYNEFCDFTYALGFAACVAAILFGPLSLQRLFSWTPLRWIGLISYGLYIWHLQLLIVLMNDILPRFHDLNYYVGYSLYWVWALIVVIPFALLFYVVIEKRWMKLGNDLRRKWEPSRSPVKGEAQVVASEQAQKPVPVAVTSKATTRPLQPANRW
ncbi:MAG TPA: acyltransferase [Ktedonobacteraceae bacterium]|nr:acyltransferase [Ktedonobacteraceae bacterium]